MGLDGLGQVQQAKEVGNCRSFQADLGGKRLLGGPKALHQQLEALCLLDCVQVLALEVLYQADHGGIIVRDCANQDRDLSKARELCCPPPSLARDQLEAVSHLAHQDGLQNPARANRVGQLTEFLFRDVLAGLEGAWLDALDVDQLAVLLVNLCSDQDLQASACDAARRALDDEFSVARFRSSFADFIDMNLASAT